MPELALFVILVLALVAMVLLLSDWLGGTKAGGIADWILGATEPFAMPSGDTDEPKLLRLIDDQPRVARDQHGVVRGLPNILILAYPPDMIRSRRQSHRNDFCDRLMSSIGTVPYRGQADHWWPGTVASPAEQRYDR